jgi:hypothetical protein
MDMRQLPWKTLYHSKEASVKYLKYEKVMTK